MSVQYLRQYSLTLGGLNGDVIDISPLHFKFSILRGDIQTPNMADIRVYNISDTTANAIQNEYAQITLQAGYEGSYGIIFQGTVKQLRRGRENATDTYFDITAADGDGFYNFGIVSASIAAGATPQQQVDAIIQNLTAPYGITKGSVTGLNSTASPRGTVLFGQARDHLRKVADTSQTSWSIQNGQINMVPLNNFIPNSTVVLTSATGLIGLPEQTQDGIKVRCLLNPNIKIGGSIQINNRSIQAFRFPLGLNTAANNALLAQSIHTNADGLYKVLWVDYSGDTRGQEWYCDITCIAIDAVLGQSQLNNPKNVIAPAGPPAPVQAYGPSNPFPGSN